MAVNLSLAEALKAFETKIEDNVGINDPTNYSQELGFLQYLFGGSNKSTISTKMGEAANGGKYKPVEIRYLPKKGTDDISESESGYNCDVGTTRRELVDTYNPTLYSQDKFTLSEAIIREGTQDSLNERIEKELKGAMLNVRENINKQMYAAAAASVGANPAASERTGVSVGKGVYSDIEMLNSDGTLSANTFDDIVNDTSDNFQLGKPGIIGSHNGRKVVHRLGVGDTQSGGINFGGVETGFGMDFYNDHFTNTVQGTANKQRVLAMYPGLAQFYQYNFYKGGLYDDKSGVSVKTTLADPIFPGITYDVHLKHSDGCSDNDPQGKLVGVVFVNFDLWTVPEEAYGEGYGDNLSDFTGIVGYNITQAS